MSRSFVLRKLRESAALSTSDVAELVGLSEPEIEAFEGGNYVEQDALERYANVFGMTRRSLLSGEDAGAVAVLFRSMRAHQALAPLASSGVQDVLGGFVRAMRERAEVRRLLDEADEPRRPLWLDEIKPIGLPPPEDLHSQARRLAAQLRTYLGIDAQAPIPSVLHLAKGLGITVLLAEAGDEDGEPAVDGAALLDPDPGILVIARRGGSIAWWRTRMIVAHELCHILHDRSSLGSQTGRGFFLFSPHRSGARHKGVVRWHLVDRFQEMEMRANAFAGELLAPSMAVRSLVGVEDPTRIESIQRVSDHFMIGTTTAVNRLRDIFQLSAEQRDLMERRALRAQIFGRSTEGVATEHPDARPPGSALRDAAFESLVLRALAAGKLNPVSARDYLGLRLSDSLPDDPTLSAKMRAPMLTTEDKARNAGVSFVHREMRGRGAFLGALEAAGGGWRASVLRRIDDGASEQIGELAISPTFAVEIVAR